jgi:hypothetical protein
MAGADKSGLLTKIIVSAILIGVFAVAGAAYIVANMSWLEWDNTDEDVQTTMPGDNLTSHPNWTYTHAITINAPADRIFPWVDQIGQDRGGFYSYDILENLAGCKIRNTDRIHPEWQYKGDGTETMILHPKMPPLRIEKVIPGVALIVHAGNFVKADGKAKTIKESDYVNMTWVFYLKKLDWNRTRLLVRWRACYYPSKENEMWYGPKITGFMNFIMGDAMIRGIKQRAENSKQ